MKNKVANMYQSGKVKVISKVFGPQETTTGAIIHKWRTLVVSLSKSDLPTKMTKNTMTTHPGHKRTRQHVKNCRPHLTRLKPEFIIQQ